jgi:catechol 2,3-dioxygenase-like lactoylglutathione lyase family enzyme
MLTNCNMVEIGVQDYEGAVVWYRDNLGLEVGYREDDHRYCEFNFPSGGLVLTVRGIDKIDPALQTRVVAAIEAINLDQTLTELTGRGVSVRGTTSEGSRNDGQKYRWASIADPEGNLMRLYEWA